MLSTASPKPPSDVDRLHELMGLPWITKNVHVPPLAQRRVARGVTWLGPRRLRAVAHKALEEHRFNISDQHCCVLGHLKGHFRTALKAIVGHDPDSERAIRWAIARGFHPDCGSDSGQLNRAWLDVFEDVLRRSRKPATASRKTVERA